MTPTAPQVPVIIPCYNQAQYLGEALRSVIGQEGPEAEIVVVDDGSSDDTRGVAGAFSGVRYVRQGNKGTAAARNSGHRESRGAYLLFLDADDRLLPGALEIGLRALNDCPACGFVYGHVRIIRSDGSLLKIPLATSVADDHYRHLLRQNYIASPGAVLYRRAAFESVGGFRPEAQGCADLDLNFRIARRWSVRCHGETVLEYRRHETSQSSNAAEMLRSAIRVRRAQRAFFEGRRDFEDALREGIREDQAYYGRRAVASMAAHLRTHQWTTAGRELLTLMRYDPARLARKMLRRPA